MFCCIIFDFSKVLPNLLIPLFFPLDAPCAAGELDIVSQALLVCVSAKQLFSTIQSSYLLILSTFPRPATICAYTVSVLYFSEFRKLLGKQRKKKQALLFLSPYSTLTIHDPFSLFGKSSFRRGDYSSHC